MVKSDNKYTKMQQDQYDYESSNWSLSNIDSVVGSFNQHNAWEDYDNYLFKNINNTKEKIALDFGCGPGRNIVKFANIFNRIDGADISDGNLKNVDFWCNHNNISFKPKTFKTDGINLSNIDNNFYDIVFSTICMQHICVYTIRFNLLTEMFRVLKSNGNICIQMGFGTDHPRASDYYEDYFDATGTNGHQDVKITDVNQIKNDLEKIGFINFEYDLRPVGPGDGHSQWIFFRATKP